MAHLLEDPRLRQRWNEFSHTTETVTENAAAGIYSFQHRYVTPCLASLGDAIEPCLAPCFGDRDERLRRAHHHGARSQQQQHAEYTFDFYDDWDDDDELLASGGGATGGRSEDWDRLVRGGGAKDAGGLADQQPRRKRGMSYGTRGAAMRRKAGGDEEDPTIIPSTAPLGFLDRLPWKIGGTLRYKPSAAFLQDHPGAASRPERSAAARDENQPLLLEDEGDSNDDDDDDDDDDGAFRPYVREHARKRSGTAGSGDTSDSFRSRGDLFPSDGEEYEDAMEIDDEFAMALERVDDRASSNTRSSKGKRPAGGNNNNNNNSSSNRKMSRAASGTTLSSSTSKSSLHAADLAAATIEDLHQREELEVERLEDQEVARKREAAARIARERGLSGGGGGGGDGDGDGEFDDTGAAEARAKSAMFSVQELSEPSSPRRATVEEPPGTTRRLGAGKPREDGQSADDFIPARLPNFR